MSQEITQVKINGFNYPLAKVRQDLLDEGTAVPVGRNYYTSAEPLPYRWTGEDGDDFQVYLNGKWHYAESIDFEF
jgi:hypothetical protein